MNLKEEYKSDNDELDEIVSGSKSYADAVDKSRLFSTGSKLQAEPSHFHLAAVANERKNPTFTA